MDVAILGCGYVGLELGRQLTEGDHRAVGVRRSAAGLDAIADAGFEAVRADVTDADSLSAVPDADAVVFAASSGRRTAAAAREVYVEGLRTVIEHFAARDDPPGRLVYTSSTGVYGDHGGDWVDEESPLDPATEKAAVLAEAERVALDEAADRGVDGTVARFAGLYGPGRFRLERYLAEPVTEGYRNAIHRDDAAGAVRFLLDADLARNEAVVVADDEPVRKSAFADWLADQCGVERPSTQTKAERSPERPNAERQPERPNAERQPERPNAERQPERPNAEQSPKRPNAERPDFEDVPERAKRRTLTSKRCSNEKLRSLGYELTYPTYREGYRNAVAAYEPETDAERDQTASRSESR